MEKSKKNNNKNQSAEKQDVAIVGIACRFPGSNNYEEFYGNLASGVNSISEIAPDRWDIDEYYSTDIKEPNKTISKWCGQVSDFKKFDNRFFNISPREAKNMDPQQRLLLEETLHCVEDSGIPLKNLKNETTSVYVGVMATDYHQESSNLDDATDSYACLGNYTCILANRISYAFGFEGASTTVDAACAASLVAIHKAKRSLLNKESDFAFASGVNLNFHPWKYISFSKSRMLSPDGQCKTFDKDANGYVPGDGVAVLLLRRLEDAVADNNHIYGIIKGSAINHGGQSVSITAPRVEAQKNVILSAYEDAGVSPETVSYVEAHGTGTSLGDPIEIEGLTKAFAEHTDKKQFCKIGSVKTNIGHLEAAAGIAGVIKVLMMMKNNKIVQTLNIKTVNPIINFKKSPFVIADQLSDWNSAQKDLPLRASVSSFGMGGVNSHVIIESFETENQINKKKKANKQTKKINNNYFLLSSRSASSLEQVIDEWKKFVTTEEFNKYKLDDICSTLMTGREAYTYRYGFHLNSKDELNDLLSSTKPNLEKVNEKNWSMRIGKLAVNNFEQVNELINQNKIFENELEYVEKQLNEVLLNKKNENKFRQKDWQESDKALYSFMVEFAYVSTLLKVGVSPEVVVGENTGIWSALIISGILELKDVLSVLKGKKEIKDIKFSRPQISFYDSYNKNILSPFNIDENYIKFIVNDLNVKKGIVEHYIKKAQLLITSQFTFKKFLEEWDPFLKTINTDIKSLLHNEKLIESDSSENKKNILLLMIIIMSSLQKLNQKWNLTEEDIINDKKFYELIDLVNDDVVSKEMIINIFSSKEINYQAIVQAVNSNQGKLNLKNDYTYLKEMNKGLVEIEDYSKWLNSIIKETEYPEFINNMLCIELGKFEKVVDRKSIIHDEIINKLDEVFSSLLLKLWLNGANVKWDLLLTEKDAAKVALPVYKFDRKEFWLSNTNLDKNNNTKVNLLTERLESKITLIDNNKKTYQRKYNIEDNIVADHVITGKTIVPGAAMVELGLESIRKVTGNNINKLSNIIVHKPGIVNSEIFTSVETNQENQKFIIKQENIVLCEGKYDLDNVIASQENITLSKYISNKTIDVKEVYAKFNSYGYGFGKSFQVIDKIWKSNNSMLFELTEKNGTEGGITKVSSNLFDGLFQCFLANISINDEFSSDNSLYVPFMIKNVEIYKDLLGECFVNITKEDIKAKGSDFSVDLRAYDASGNILFYVQNMLFKKVPSNFLELKPVKSQVILNDVGLYKPAWLAQENNENSEMHKINDAVIIIDDNSNLKEDLLNKLKEKYNKVSIIKSGNSFKANADNNYEINYENYQEYETVLKSIIDAKSNNSNNIDIYNIIPFELDSIKIIKSEQLIPAQLGVRSLFLMSKTIKAKMLKTFNNIIIVSSNSYIVEPSDKALGYMHGGFLGLIKTLKLECKFVNFKILDFDNSYNNNDISGIVFNESITDKENEIVAFRNKSRYVQSIMPVTFTEENKDVNTSLKDDGVYILVGGAGGIGVKVAHMISEKVKSKIVILGRSDINDSKQQLLDQLTAKGSEALYVKADVTSYKQMEDAINTVKEKYGKINGIFQTSGILDDKLIVMKDWESFESVLSPKIIGTWILNEVLKSEKLDFFMVFSSIASIVGNMGQTDYTTANSYLDAFVHYRNSNNYHGKTIGINWTLWADGGMGLTDVVIKQLRQIGIEPMPGEDGINALNEILNHNEAQLVVLKGTIDKLLATRGKKVGSIEKNQAITNVAVNEASVQQEIVSQNKDTNVSEIILKTLSEVLSVPEDEIDLDTDITDYGVDSVAIMEIVDRLSEKYGDSFYHSIIIENPTVNQLTSYIENNILDSENSNSQAIVNNNNIKKDKCSGLIKSIENMHEILNAKPNTEVDNQKINNIIVSVLSEVLSVPEDEIDFDTDITDYGVDSVAIMEIVDKLSEVYGDSFYHSIIIENPTVNQLANYIIENIEQVDTGLSTVSSDSSLNAEENNQQTTSYSNQTIASTEQYSSNNEVSYNDNSYQPIAVIGASGRFPGSDSIDEFWNNLKDGKLLVDEVPFDRFKMDSHFVNERGVVNKTYSKWAGLLENISCFDAKYFNVKDDDAKEIDPQQRIFLEVIQELWDRSGYQKKDISGTKTGVFIGAHESNYGRKIEGRKKYHGPNGVVNVISNLIAGRLMHHYDLRGPAEMIYTACSSSLVAIHKACRSLQLNECEMAISGGIELLLDEDWFIGFSESKVLSPEGKCKVFDHSADGFVLGEGAGAVLLKRLDKAIADGDQILGVIKGSATNNDGQTMGLTTPNMNAQKEVIHSAYINSKIDPSSVTYYEAHGTATPLGDPIEVKAATQVFKEYTSDKNYCAIGSVKSNIGHLLSAAGIASFIKVLLSITNKQLPPTINCNNPHPRFEFEKSPFYPNTKLQDWTGVNGLLRAGISSFGFGGTNCHLILENFNGNNYSNYNQVRQSLPVTQFNRNHYWINEPVTTEKELVPYKIFKSLENGSISVDQAKARAKAWKAIS